MSSTDNSVAIIGGGITGLTTAVLLRAHGYRTHLYARDHPFDVSVKREPAFATVHAIASVIPHSVRSPAAARWTSISQQYFRALSAHAQCGVRSQPHNEVFEADTVAPPDYASAVEGFTFLSATDFSSGSVPRRQGASALSGWRFNAFFCDAPVYLRYLHGLYKALGGHIAPRSELPGTGLLPYLALDHAFYVNATGSAAPSFIASAAALQRAYRERDLPGDSAEHELPFEPLADPWPTRLIRGHYLRLDVGRVPADCDGRLVSYNYTPAPTIYQTARGEPADVYCYPRSDQWILGGSRQAGNLGRSGEWIGEETVGEEKRFACASGNGVVFVPAPIFDLNAELLANMTGGCLDLERTYRRDPSVIEPGMGYRFVRDSPAGNVRLAASRLRLTERGIPATKYVVHNYGHGGAGFALSWGCAADVLRILAALSVGVGARPQRLDTSGAYATTQSMLLELTSELDEVQEHQRR